MRTPRATTVVALAMLGWLVASCGNGGGGGLLTVAVPLDIDEQTIHGYAPQAAQPACTPNAQGVGSLGPDTIAPISFDIKDAKELKGQPLLRFADVVLRKVTLTVLIPPSQDGQTWDFIDSISIFADDPSDSNPPVLVAKLDPVPRGLTQMVIPGTGVDISDIASKDHFVVSGTASGRPPCADVHFDGEADFDVTLF